MGRCPFCGSTDIYDIDDGPRATVDRRGCLDCDGSWTKGGRSKGRTRKVRRTNAEARRIINQRNHRWPSGQLSARLVQDGLPAPEQEKRPR